MRHGPIRFNGRIGRRGVGRDRQQRQRDRHGKGGAAGDGGFLGMHPSVSGIRLVVVMVDAGPSRMRFPFINSML